MKLGPDPVFDEEFELDDIPPDVFTVTVTVFNKVGFHINRTELNINPKNFFFLNLLCNNSTLLAFQDEKHYSIKNNNQHVKVHKTLVSSANFLMPIYKTLSPDEDINQRLKSSLFIL